MKPLSLRRRKIRALRIFKQPAFRRNLPTPAIAKEAMEFLKKNLTNSASFLRLTTSFPDVTHYPHIREFEYKKTKFVIKNTSGSKNQGHTKEVKNNEIRKFIKLHHYFFRRNGLRKKVNYILRTPRLFGIIGDYLVMEKIERWNPKTKEETELYLLAQQQARDIFQELAKTTEIRKPQVEDFIPTGIHNGKIVFHVVYDYY